MNLTENAKNLVYDAGGDIVGVVSVDHLEHVIPTGQTPSKCLGSGISVVVYGVHVLRGVIQSGDLRLKRYNAVEACRMCDEIGLQLAYLFEKIGFESLVIHADMPVDFEKGGGMFGDLSLRHVAVEAGLGEIGLSTNFLCKDYGAHIYLGAVLTSANLVPDKRMERHLCEGEACGLCVEACPVGAIRGDGTKDHNLCMVEAMPFGPRNLLRHFYRILKGKDEKKQGDLVYSLETLNAWQSLITKLGVFGGCFRCMDACPIGWKAD